MKNFVPQLIFDDFTKNDQILVNNIKNINSYNENSSVNVEDFHYRYSNDNTYFKGEIALWKAVILQALVDLQSNSKKKIANTYRIKALMWFNLKNEDFITVCNYAGLDPKYVYERSRIVKENNKFFK